MNLFLLKCTKVYLWFVLKTMMIYEKFIRFVVLLGSQTFDFDTLKWCQLSTSICLLVINKSKASQKFVHCQPCQQHWIEWSQVKVFLLSINPWKNVRSVFIFEEFRMHAYHLFFVLNVLPKFKAISFVSLVILTLKLKLFFL